MSKTPPPDGKGPPPSIQPSSEQKGTIASLRASITNFLSFIFRPITFVWKTAKFESAAEKKQLKSEIQNKMEVRDRWMLSFLDKANRSEVEFFNSALGHAATTGARTGENLVPLERALFTQAVTGRPKFASGGKARALATLKLAAQIDQLLGNRPTPKSKVQLFDFLINCSPTSRTTIKNYISEMQRLRALPSESPKRKHTPELEQEKSSFVEGIVISEDGKQARKKWEAFGKMIEEIFRETVVLKNVISGFTQPAIKSIYIPPYTTKAHRLFSVEPRARAEGAEDFALFSEVHTANHYYEDSEDIIDFNQTIQILFVDPRTKITRTYETKLPFSGKGTITEFREKLRGLDESINQTTGADEANLKWLSRVEDEIAPLFHDFHTAPEPAKAFTPKETIAQATALNIYRLEDGSLALVPELGEDTALAACMTDTPMVPAFYSGNMFETVETNREINWNAKKTGDTEYFEITTTIRDPLGRSHTRTTYRKTEGEPAAEVMKKYTAKGFEERDGLLAKAEFMKKHGSVDEKRWNAHFFSKGTLPSATLRDIQESLKDELDFHGKAVNYVLTVGEKDLSLSITGKMVKGQLTLSTSLVWPGTQKTPTQRSVTIDCGDKTAEKALEEHLARELSTSIREFATKDDFALALEASQPRDIFFQADGTRALTAMKHSNPNVQACITIPKETVERLSTSSEGVIVLPGYYSKDSFETLQASCKLTSREEEKEGVKNLEITAMIQDGVGRALKTSTSIPMEGKNSAQVMQEYKEKGSLEEFLLLAKAEFMKKHGSVDEKSWREHCFKTESRLPNETVKGIREELTANLGPESKSVERLLEYGRQKLIVKVTGKQEENNLIFTTSVKWRFVAGKTEPKTREVTLDITDRNVDEVLQERLEAEISGCMQELGYYE